MYYIFNERGILISTCDFEPNLEDLQSRNEYFVKSEEPLKQFRVVGGKYGGIYETIETPEELLQNECFKVIQQRNKLLDKTDWVTSRHFEEKMSGKETTLSDTQISEFLEYRQSLRDITESDSFPYIVFPQQPQFLE